MSDPDPGVEALIEAVRAAVRDGTLTAKQVAKLTENVKYWGERRQPPPENGLLLSCSFCAKSQKEVRKLIVGPAVFICDECIRLCNHIIREEDGTSAEPPA